MIKPELKKKIKELILLKFKFGLSGLVATSINIGLFYVLHDRFLPLVPANIVAYSIAVVVNFMLHKRFVFEANGKVSDIFIRSMLVSLIGMGLDTGILYLLHQIPLFETGIYEKLPKLISTGIVFFYNFYFKRYAFEKKFI
ncbi:MAG: GtrA family protein [Bacteroidota bacterium]